MNRKNHIFPDLKPLLVPESIAVIGASDKPGPGRQVIENLIQLGYRGPVYPVNPRYEDILGMPCYPSLTEVHRAGHRVEMVAILLKRHLVIPVLKEAASIGVRAGWAFANGFGEAGPEGRALQEELTAVCKQNKILFCGPNCVGYLHPKADVGAYSAPAPDSFKLGSVGLIAQSGYLTLSVANSSRGLGFSLLCSSGNEAVVDSTDFIAYMLDDPGTEVILAFIEQFRRPERLPELARRARDMGKPIILIKTGRSAMAKRATVAHTGAIAGSDDVQDALFKKLGIVRVDDFNEMFETAELFSKLLHRLPKGDGIFSLSLSGGAISLIADLGEELNLRYPPWSDKGKATLRTVLPPYAGIDNPLDAWGFGKIEETYETCLMAAVREEKADLVLVSQDVPQGMASGQAEQYGVVARAAVEAFKKGKKPVVVLSNPSVGFHPGISEILDQGRVPLLQGTREGLKAVKSLMSYAEFKRKRKLDDIDRARPSGIPQKLDFAKPADGRVLTEFASKKILAAYGVNCPPELLCTSLEETLQAAKNMGYPVALKAVSPQIQHKTEAGIIRLDLEDEDAVQHAYGEVLEKARTFDTSAQIEGILCQKMIKGAVAEAIVGILMDRSFGPSVLFGLGGVIVEVIKDRVLGIPPLSRDEALEMIGRTRGSQLLYGFRGSPRADLEALSDTLIRISWLAIDAADRIETLDINPLLIMPDGMGVTAVDALIELQEDS
jgi:acyl-CoA synthetase (NDP forming)